MSSVIELGAGLWNLRGSFKIGGILDIGTQASLVRLTSGAFVLLDACELSGEVLERVRALTGDGRDLDAILHLHPFHTVYVRRVHEQFPRARLFGTIRHHQVLSDLPWQEARTETPELWREFEDDFQFTVPRGVHLVPEDPKLHFSSVLALHRASRALHVDDTLVYVRLPRLLRFLGRDRLRFHFTLARVLEERAGAAAEFRAWADELIELCRSAKHLCTAHVHPWTDCGGELAGRVSEALAVVEGKLDAHRARWG